MPQQLENRKQSEPVPVVREGYSRSLSHVRRVDLRLPMKHRKILSEKIRQLQDTGARLQDGTHVTDKTKAILWIIENEVDITGDKS